MVVTRFPNPPEEIGRDVRRPDSIFRPVALAASGPLGVRAWRLISQSKDHDARPLAPGGCEYVSKIQIECKNNSVLCHGFHRDLRVGKTDEAFVAEVDRVMMSRAQRFHGRVRHTHVS